MGEELNQGALLEVTSVALQGLLYPLGLKPRPIEALGPGCTRPVILIHGWGSNRSCMLPIEAYLRAVGFDRVFPFHYGPGGAGAGIEPLAERLSEFVDRVREACASDRKTVDLVAHSLGGLAARVYLQEMGGARHVDQCITIGTPHLGTYSSYWAPTAVGRQMRPESDFMASLNDGSSRAPGVRYLSIWAELDLMILPRENAVYPEGDDTRIDGVGHSGILLHPRTMKLVVERLRAGQDISATRLQRVGHLARGIWRTGRRLVGAVRVKKP